MIIYMLLNLIEERCYVGQTVGTLEARVQEHGENSRGGSMSYLSVAMRKWDAPYFWDAVILQRCSSESVLDAMETWWIDECYARDVGVGYNMKRGSPDKKRAKPMTDERREFFRECGRRGAQAAAVGNVAKPKRVSPIADMTDEEKRAYFSECGKRGAGKPKPRKRPLND